LYQGGAEFAAIRQARDKLQAAYSDTVNARRQSVVQAVQSWESLQSSKATVQSLKEQVLADGIALDGTERQEIVGTSTMLDVLNAQQLLLQAQTQQIENVGNIVIDSYAVVAAMGRLTAGDLDLPVHHYDDLKYYRAVKHSLFGEGNAAYESVGISPNGDLLEGRHPIEAH
jgi:outer membrane protein